MTRDLLEYVYERVVKRLVDLVPGATEESEGEWFDQMIEDWIRAQQPAGAESVGEEVGEAEVEYRTQEGEPLAVLNVEFGGAAEERAEDAANVPDYDPPPLRERHSADLVQLWMRAAYEPWPDLPLEQAAKVMAERVGYSVPRPPLTHSTPRRAPRTAVARHQID